MIRRMLVWIALAVVAAAAVWLWRRLTEVENRLVELRRLRAEIEEARAEFDGGLALTRTHLARVVAGDPPAAAVIRAGQAWEDIQSAPALVLYQQTPDLYVLDVRTEAEFASGHIPRASLVPVDELEDRLADLPPRDTRMLVTCAAGGRSLQACRTLAEHGYTQLLNLVGGMHAWAGPREEREPEPPPANLPEGTAVAHNGGAITGEQVIGAIRECFDPEIPLNIYDLGLIYGIDIDASAIAVKMTLTSEACPSARAIPEDVKKKVAALGQPNVTVDVVFDPPWHPSRISPEGKGKLGL
jgi:metal-sulfur cluster biosynthetic enzyme/rhodanese-related sulfurtransferase